MKRLLKITILSVLIVIILMSNVFAASGLNAFVDVQKMDSTTFMDVDSLAWYFGGVCHVYNKGLMEGVSQDKFAPKDTLTWAQAITIASRIHATYYGWTLSTGYATGQSWYTPYYLYAQGRNLLPSNTPNAASLDSIIIDRQSAAYLLSKSVDEKELPAISDLVIPDYDKIGDEFKDSVKLMYSAGVINGTDNNMFDPSASLTRAQMATIITRLVMPSQRIGHDYKENADMADLQSSMMNDCVAVSVNNEYYCAFKRYIMSNNGDAGVQVYSIYKTDGNDNCTEVYQASAGTRISDLSVYKGNIYFCQTNPGTNKGSLVCYYPSTGRTIIIYEGNALKSYYWYADKLYALVYSNMGNSIDDDQFTFGVVGNGTFSRILGPYTYYEAMSFNPYGFNNNLYFVLTVQNKANLYCYSISEDKLTQLTNTNINDYYFKSHVMYFQTYNEDGTQNLDLQALSFAMSDCIDVLGTFTTDTDQTSRVLYGRKGYTYCLAADNGKVVRMDDSGTCLSVINADGAYHSITFVDDKIIMVPNSLITSNPNEIKVYNLASYSARHVYGDWIGVSCWYKGARFVADNEQSVYSSVSTVSTERELEIQITETYFSGKDLIVRAKYYNNTNQKLDLRKQYVYVYVGGELVAQSVNDFVSMTLVKNAVQTFTFVISEKDQLQNADLATGNILIEIRPTFEAQTPSYSISSSVQGTGSFDISVNGTKVKTSNSMFAAKAYEGELVSITPKPGSNYKYVAADGSDKTSYVVTASGKMVDTFVDGSGNLAFYMPGEDVTVVVKFEPAT